MAYKNKPLTNYAALTTELKQTNQAVGEESGKYHLRSLASDQPNQVSTLVTKFDDWAEGNAESVGNIMPWKYDNSFGYGKILATKDVDLLGNKWGTLSCTSGCDCSPGCSISSAMWMNPEMQYPNAMWYWMKENRPPIELQCTEDTDPLEHWKQVSKEEEIQLAMSVLSPDATSMPWETSMNVLTIVTTYTSSDCGTTAADDLIIVYRLLKAISASDISSADTAIQPLIKNFINSASGLLKTKHRTEWVTASQFVGASSVMATIDEFAQKVSEALLPTDIVVVDAENIIFVVQMMNLSSTNTTGVEFTNNDEDWSVTISSDVFRDLLDIHGEGTKVAFIGVLYKNVSELLTNDVHGGAVYSEDDIITLGKSVISATVRINGDLISVPVDYRLPVDPVDDVAGPYDLKSACVFLEYKHETLLPAERISIHKNLILAIMLSHLVSMATESASQVEVACKIFAVLLHYTCTAMFLWMLAEGIHLYRQIVAVYGSERSWMNYYYTMAWGTPFLIVAITAGIRIEDYGAVNHCWLSVESGLIWAFVGPAILIMTGNLVVLIMVVRVVVSASHASGQKQNDHVKAGVKSSLLLLPLLGITWCFGLFATGEETIAFLYIFSILNSLQGLFIFLFHVVYNSEVRAALRRKKEKFEAERGQFGTSTNATAGSWYTRSTMASRSTRVTRMSSEQTLHLEDVVNDVKMVEDAKLSEPPKKLTTNENQTPTARSSRNSLIVHPNEEIYCCLSTGFVGKDNNSPRAADWIVKNQVTENIKDSTEYPVDRTYDPGEASQKRLERAAIECAKHNIVYNDTSTTRVVSNKYKVIINVMAKVGSGTWRRFMREIDPTCEGGENKRRLNSLTSSEFDQYVRGVFFREPLERLVSFYHFVISPYSMSSTQYFSRYYEFMRKGHVNATMNNKPYLTFSQLAQMIIRSWSKTGTILALATSIYNVTNM
uniref:Uncharacterized protein LOC102807533 n=1 Tax=Saccoglossus kowalevskii TaxID=10224 RepID=A0ABM0MFK4_SACKO|nr:PREDICTED: uncharacterized protein LOC102807533 [Saccoglossus kowalevskii]